MAGTNGQFDNLSSLDSNQQDLLLAALSSNQPNQQQKSQLSNNIDPNFSFNGMDPSLFLNNNPNIPLGNFDSPLVGAMDNSPYVDFLDSNDPNFELDYNDEDGQMIGDLPGADELHDKRKSPEDNSEDNENGGKRREGDDKTAKKPGRKPLTSEPTSKRKAQNRAAQRAFRERKEKHLKDLETKVGELEKASESANHENGLLRAQVDRLQIELREYRKRLSLNNSSGVGRSSPTSSSGLNLLSSQANGNSSNNFQFDFPKFGSLPTTAFIETTNPINPSAGSGFTSPSNTAPGVLARSGSAAGNISPRTQARLNGSISSANGLPASSSGNQTTSANNLDSLFSDSALVGLSGSPSTDYNAFLPNTTTSHPNMNGTSEAGSISNASGQSRIFQFNSTSVSSDSPGSSSSISQYGGPNSSCGTSPEPSHNSPSTGNKDATLDTINEASTETGEASFCDKLSMACGNIKNPVPRANSQSNGTSAEATSTIPSTTAGSSFSADPVQNFDWFATQNGGTFDPVLFGDYREPQNAIVGDGDFTGGFFNDAMPASFDFSSPFNWADLTAPTGLTPSIQKSNPLEQADALSSGLENITEEVVPGENTDKLLTCNKIWDKLQNREDFKDGSLDIDGLCSELRAKARCSESGVVIDQQDVDSALQRLPASRANSGQM